MIYKTGEAITESVIMRLIEKNEAANVRISRLQDYYEGRQAIIYRTMGDPAKPNNKIVVNYCQYITDFLTGYLVGEPVAYENAPEWLLDALAYNDSDDETERLVSDMNTCGVAFELHYTDEDGKPRFAEIDPKEAILILDDTLDPKPRAFIRYYPVFDLNDNKRFEVAFYTDVDITYFTLDGGLAHLSRKGDPVQHFYNDVPVAWVTNGNKAMGSFEQVMSMQDALNKVTSDELNDFEGFVDSYLVLENMGATDSADIARMKEDRVLLLEPNSKAYWLTKQVNDTQVKELKDRLEKKIKELGRVLDWNNEHIYMESGEALKVRLIATETQARKQERSLTRCIMRRLELMYNIEGYKAETGAYTDVTLSFVRGIRPDMIEPDYTKEAAGILGV